MIDRSSDFTPDRLRSVAYVTLLQLFADEEWWASLADVVRDRLRRRYGERVSIQEAEPYCREALLAATDLIRSSFGEDQP